jgi:hypothetical protein
MILIVVYAGGNIITGSTGIDYDNPPRFSFLENEDMCFDEVRTMIANAIKRELAQLTTK